MTRSVTGQHPLRATSRPDFELGAPTLRVVDLFSGCGGLTLGVSQAASDHGWAIEIALAVDLDSTANSVYKINFPKAVVRADRVEDLFDGSFQASSTSTEQMLVKDIGTIHALIGGPPCQGHSDLNNHTRRNDPKNLLYLRMARAAEVLKPRIVLIENVPAVQHDKRNVVGRVQTHLSALGYRVSDCIVQLDKLGIAQRRRRHLLLATRPDWPDPHDVFSCLAQNEYEDHDLNWAIGDLAHITPRYGLDQVPRASKDNLRRMAWLLQHDRYDLPNSLRPICHQNDHSYKSMYGRLRWDQPAQTITSGFTSIGQGRYMHPDQMRALTAHEAARIQGFPDYFDFSAVVHRTALSTMVGNAVPPQLGREVFGALLRMLRDQP
jgi:DNA (cytosine-5)-methyltransferase 1